MHFSGHFFEKNPCDFSVSKWRWKGGRFGVNSSCSKDYSSIKIGQVRIE
jgi:hypothetical protein